SIGGIANDGLAGLANCVASPPMATSRMIQNARNGHTLVYDQRPSRYKTFDIVQLSLVSFETFQTLHSVCKFAFRVQLAVRSTLSPLIVTEFSTRFGAAKWCNCIAKQVSR